MVTTIQSWFCYSNQRITITTLTYKTFILIRDLDKHAVEATEQKNAVVNHTHSIRASGETGGILRWRGQI